MYRLCQFTKLVSETESQNIGDPLYRFCIAPFVRFFDTTIKSSFFQVRQKKSVRFYQKEASERIQSQPISSGLMPYQEYGLAPHFKKVSKSCQNDFIFHAQS